MRITVLLAMLLAGLIGISLSAPLQAPAVILLGVSGILAAIGRMSGSRQASGECVTGALPGGHFLLWLTLASIVYFVFRACLSPVWDLAAEDLMLIFSSASLYLVAGYGLNLKTSRGIRQALAWAIIILLVLHIGSCLNQMMGGNGYSLALHWLGATRSSAAHITGMYGYYGSFANFAVVSGLLCLCLGIWGRFHVFAKLALLLLGGGALILAIFSQSRAAALSMVPALALLAILLIVSVSGQNNRIKKSVKTGVGACALVALLGGGAGLVWVFQSRAHGAEVSGLDLLFDSGLRLPFWSMATEQWLDYPMVGAGSRSYSYLSNVYWSPNLASGEASPEFAHNEYLQLLADYGLIGLLCIMVLLFWHGFTGIMRVKSMSEQMPGDAFKHGSNSMALTIAGVCGLAAMSVHIVFDFRTHILANLLLLVCCAVWVLPAVHEGQRQHGFPSLGRMSNGGICGCMLLLGASALALGSLQLWAGLPLIQNKMAKEDGTWNPRSVDRDVWIPALEESVRRVPEWRRFQRLGALYRQQALDTTGQAGTAWMEQSKAAYVSSLERHSLNPIAKINLASIHTQAGNWQEAEALFASASEMAMAREKWYRMHSQWAAMHLLWASECWSKGELKETEMHFDRARELYLKSYKYGYFHENKEYVVEYTRALVAYARFLDKQGEFAKAETLFQEGKSQVNWYNWQPETKLNLHYGIHQFEHGKKIWYQRKPEEAYRMMLESKASLHSYRSAMKGDVEETWQEKMTEVQGVIDFLKAGGVGAK